MKYFSIKNYLIIIVKGMLMGIADLVPGISGGTIALITGIYKDLITALNNLTSVSYTHLTLPTKA